MSTLDTTLSTNTDVPSWALVVARVQNGTDSDAGAQIRTLVRNGLSLMLSRRVPPDIDVDGLADVILDLGISAVRNGELRDTAEFPSLLRRIANDFKGVERFATRSSGTPVIAESKKLGAQS